VGANNKVRIRKSEKHDKKTVPKVRKGVLKVWNNKWGKWQSTSSKKLRQFIANAFLIPLFKQSFNIQPTCVLKKRFNILRVLSAQAFPVQNCFKADETKAVQRHEI